MKKNFLGIDIGSVALGIALIDENNHLIHSGYIFHKGRIIENMRHLLKKVNLHEVQSLGFTSSSPSIFSCGLSVDTRIAQITAAKFFHPEVQSLLIIGAEKFGLVTFDAKGQYLNFKSNSSCAAGTGNFLDQQAERLNLADIQEFSRLAFENTGAFPKIASRCAVFAKTDLIHAQQEGYSPGEICDGLSFGLAKNIVDTVFQNNTFLAVVAAGGVALNKAVIGHIENLIGQKITVDEFAPIYGAIGAAISCREEIPVNPPELKTAADLLISEIKEKTHHFPPLQLKLSVYPDFESAEKYEFISSRFPAMNGVEVDVYSIPKNRSQPDVYLGIDIGSTSTKAILMNRKKEVIAGFYTSTSGQPLQAVQLLFETIRDFCLRKKISLHISGVGTTGSGRKFIGKIIGADCIPDEITAHARAAFELNPETDTIIEIGGQDSKFTVMRNGMVTFSVMNNVCAAGTGSFIEEQARRLGCSLTEYARKVETVSSPMASDRCTVFMERDLNHYLMAGYSTDEILAAVLHSTRENYLSKVAVKGFIGNVITFQGATAKNKALVAAFEQKLKKPIQVSKYCHLAGALGVALELHDRQVTETRFRGIDLYKRTIPVRSEICEICTNHCKLKVAELEQETEAYGFLCGRDYHEKKYIRNKTGQFELIRSRQKLFKFSPVTHNADLTVGIPAGLHLYDEMLFWQKFFDFLSIQTVTSDDYATAIKDGKKLSGAEFCAPIAAMHGHVDYLRDKSDFIFLPVYLEESQEEKTNKLYCYYTQYISSVISVQKSFKSGKKLLIPVLKYFHGELFIRLELFRMIKSMGLNDIGFIHISLAYDKAKEQVRLLKEEWKDNYRKEAVQNEDIHVMLLGRPYTVLSPMVNNSIPEIIEKMGIKTFFMDMLPDRKTEISKADELIKTIKWKFASRILYAADLVSRTENCYPVLITSFKCTPDSFVIEYFKEMFDAIHKPYLILQLDEHDSAVGYETRIEAAVRVFRNHRDRQKSGQSNKFSGENGKMQLAETTEKPTASRIWPDQIHALVDEASQVLRTYGIDFRKFSSLVQQFEMGESNLSKPILDDPKNLKNKTLLLPSWDPYVAPLLEAVLQNGGIDARVAETSEESIRQSLSFNTGQCLPLSIIVQNSIGYMEQNRLNPADTALWIMKSKLSCNLSMFPWFMKKLLSNYGHGMEKTLVYEGDVIFYDFSLATAINAYLAYMLGGFIRKIGCSIRPYEKQKGRTDALISESLLRLKSAFREGKLKEPVLEKIIQELESIEIERTNRPKVAIFGDLYVRDNDLFNQNLIRMVEDYGGEVITTPYSEYMKIVVDPSSDRFLKEGRYFDFAKLKFLKSLIPLVEENYKRYLYRYNGEAKSVGSLEMDAWLNQFGLNVLQRGESLENILKIHRLIRQYPDLDLFIQTNPSYCCPSLVTEAMTSRIEEITGVPVVTIEYDGTAGIKNEDIIPYLKYRKRK